MYKHILVPTDGSALSLKAARAAARLAGRIKARITAVYVIEPFMPPGAGIAFIPRAEELANTYAKASREMAVKALGKVKTAARAANVPCSGVSLVNDRPWDGIVSTARKNKCDLIVMATHGRSGLGKLFLGSETAKVLAHTKTPVLVCR